MKEKTDNLNIRLPVGMREGLRALSKLNNRSMNGQVIEVLQKAIDASIPKPN